MTRKAFERVGGLYDKGILGSGDNIMAITFINKGKFATNKDYCDIYNQSMLDFQVEAKKLRLGYTPGVIRHHYHGTKQNRQYTERWKILMKHNYSPIEHVTYDDIGLLVPTDKFPEEFKTDIIKYFQERKEDD